MNDDPDFLIDKSDRFFHGLLKSRSRKYVVYGSLLFGGLLLAVVSAYSIVSVVREQEAEPGADVIELTVVELPAAVPNGGLIVDQSELDFGEVWETNDFPWRLTIRNPTLDDVTIREFRPLCSCTFWPRSLTIPAGQ